jgi:hypothetical protein
MVTMNHTNLTTYNVPALTEFFCSVFGFEPLEKRGDKFSTTQNEAVRVCTLTRRLLSTHTSLHDWSRLV